MLEPEICEQNTTFTGFTDENEIVTYDEVNELIDTESVAHLNDVFQNISTHWKLLIVAQLIANEEVRLWKFEEKEKIGQRKSDSPRKTSTSVSNVPNLLAVQSQIPILTLS